VEERKEHVEVSCRHLVLVVVLLLLLGDILVVAGRLLLVLVPSRLR
jgi:hypothetical protein